MPQSALIIDDDRTERRRVSAILQNRMGLSVMEAENGEHAVDILEGDHENRIKLAVLDLEMPVMGGLEALKIISQAHPQLPVIVLTGTSDMNDAVEAMKTGAMDFISKPVSPERMEVSAKNALKLSLMTQEISRLKKRGDNAIGFDDLIGHDAGLSASVLMGRKAASCDLPVLMSGETGTGKEMFACAIHGESKRAGQPFIAVNCGAIPEKLVESTLFGHEKGSFTGATAKALGKFQEASGGTIFLDEVGELPPESQVKLLRALQQKEVEPVGAARPVRVDVRVISATNRDLPKDVSEGKFREDLYFRLHVLNIDLPPLRERKEDIPVLTEYFISRFSASHAVLPKEISQEALRKLQAYTWPGNVRELENAISRAMALCEAEKIDAEHIFLTRGDADPPLQAEGKQSFLRGDGSFKSMKEIEQEVISLALSHHKNNMSQTAKALGIAKSTLYTKINRD